MNVLPEDQHKAVALERGWAYCMEKAIEWNDRGLRSHNIEHFRESKRWLVDASRCQHDLEELKARKEEFDGAQIIYVQAKILGGWRNG